MYYVSRTKGADMDKEKAMAEFKKYEKMRMQMYDFFDKYIPKKDDGTYDFEKAQNLDAKESFNMFFKLDYQARKIRGIAINCLGIKAE